MYNTVTRALFVILLKADRQLPYFVTLVLMSSDGENAISYSYNNYILACLTMSPHCNSLVTVALIYNYILRRRMFGKA